MSAADANNRPNDTADPGTDSQPGDPPSHARTHSFITNLKSFNIDPASKYKHYGHLLLLNARAVESLMAEPQSPSLNQEHPPADPARTVIDEAISAVLGIPPQILAADAVWPYTSDTLNEIVRYKAEQERTRQESLRHDSTVAALELLRTARSMNMSAETLVSLFNDSSIEALTAKRHHLQRSASNSEVVDPCGGDGASCRRRGSDSRILQGGAGNGDPDVPRAKSRSASMLTTRSLSKLPPLVHRRVRSDGSDPADHKDREASTAAHTPKSLPAQHLVFLQHSLPGPLDHPRQRLPNRLPNRSPASASYHGPPHASHNSSPHASSHPHSRTHSHNHSPPNRSPQSAHQTHHTPQTMHRMSPGSGYQVYYDNAGGSAGSAPNGAPTGTPGGVGHVGGSVPVPPRVNGGLGSPYNLKYPTIVYSGPFNSQYLPPQLSYQYYVGPPPGAAVSGPPPGHYLVPSMPGQIVYPPSDEHAKREDEESSPGQATKRHRSNPAKSSSINFMITTPKNPPAKKYNNTKGNS